MRYLRNVQVELTRQTVGHIGTEFAGICGLNIQFGRSLVSSARRVILRTRGLCKHTGKLQRVRGLGLHFRESYKNRGVWQAAENRGGVRGCSATEPKREKIK